VTFRKGEPRSPNAGRKKGTPNKLTVDVKAAILEAFTSAGGAKYLESIASNHPAVFCTLVGKVLPTKLENDPQNPVGLTIICPKPD
jgi:hypothetical protein